MNTVPLGEDLGIESCAEIQQTLAPFLDQDGPVQLDASQVQRVHTASFQVVYAFVTTRRQAGLETHIEPSSESFNDAVRLLGLGEAIGLKQPEPMS